jgi:hypothetical protein
MVKASISRADTHTRPPSQVEAPMARSLHAVFRQATVTTVHFRILHLSKIRVKKATTPFRKWKRYPSVTS